MSLGLIKPGMSAAFKVHPKTGDPIYPLYAREDGSVVWPVMGGAPDPNDPDDPDFTGEDDDDEDEDDDEEEKPSSKKKSKSSTKDDEDEEDDDAEGPSKAQRQAKRYRLRLREEERKNADMAARLKSLEDKDKPSDEVVSRDLEDARSKVDALTEVNRIQSAQLAFFKTPVPGIEWIDASDVFALAEREGLFDDVIDEDGTVDTAELRRGLKDLARRKKHLVKKSDEDPKARSRKDSKDEDDEDDEEPRSRQSGSTMNSTRRGKKGAGTSRDDLVKKFPVLGRL